MAWSSSKKDSRQSRVLITLVGLLWRGHLGNAEACTASGGNRDGPCVFPYEYGGTLHNECKDHDNSGRDWCATKVKSGNKLDKWGYCDCGCPTTSICSAYGGNKDGPCIFPYEYGGTLHNKCGDHDNSGTEWCATKVKGDGKLDKWGYCSCGCYATTTTSTTTTVASPGENNPAELPMHLQTKSFQSFQMLFLNSQLSMGCLGRVGIM